MRRERTDIGMLPLNDSGGGRISRSNRGPAHLSHNSPSQQNLAKGQGKGGKLTTAQFSQAEAMMGKAAADEFRKSMGN